ncbi:hypothetical protein BJX99DRAFT_227380 [Aspergillus californicus]
MAPTLSSPRGFSAKRFRSIRSNRTHVQSYNEESDEESPDREEPGRLSLSLRPRSSHRTPLYREDTTDDDFDAYRAEDPNNASPSEQLAGKSTPSTPTRARRSLTVRTRSSSQKQKRTPTKQQLVLGQPLNKRRRVEDADILPISPGVIPPWQTLPYHILLDIFMRASYPLVNETAVKRNPSVNWLVGMAMLCHSFHEPALAALYRSPPLVPVTKSHSLLSLLEKDQDSLSTNYVNKIKELEVDVEHVLVYKSGPTLGYFDLAKLIDNTPQLRAMRLYHIQDYYVGLPPWEFTRPKWVYPDTLFASLNSRSIRLRSWVWNARFMKTQNLLPLMLAQHRQSSFKSCQGLRVLHVAAEDADGDRVFDMADDREDVLAMALAELTDLRRLEFLESSILNENLLPNLPSCLTSLTINNCDHVTTANLGLFLSSHGHSLRELDLRHNRNVSLSFIVDLKASCGTLEKFTVDISMRDSSSFRDVEPHFEELLGPSEIPTWPRTLQQLELNHLRKWDAQIADGFFVSLIEAAPELRNLRRLAISAKLTTGWRDRATFRERWIGKLERVFLRPATSPKPTPHQSQQQQQDEAKASEVSIPESDRPSPSKRKSARIANRTYSDGEDDHGSSPRGSRTHEDDSDHDLPIAQGMCEAVEIRIDNLRPRETQFNEGDFLDEEASGDDEWTGYDVDLHDRSYAW